MQFLVLRMAARPELVLPSTDSNDGIEQVTSKLGAASIRDSVEAEISILCWNIKGDAKKDSRVKVTNATFRSVPMFRSLDLICFQEMTVAPEKCSRDYFTDLDMSKYGVEKIREDGGSQSVYAAVIYNKDIFSECSCKCVSNAFDRMELKKQFYNVVSTNDVRIQHYVTGSGSVDDVRRILRREAKPPSNDLCRDILSECAELGNVQSFKDKLLPRYRAQSADIELKSPRDLLKRRAAMVLLKLKSREFYFLVISVHVPRKSAKGTQAEKLQDPVALRYAYLFFDFLEKLRLVDLPRNMRVLIAGDFNIDITKEPGLRKFLCKYECPLYTLDKLRRDLPMIDFILCRKFFRGDSHIPRLTQVRALPLCGPDALTIDGDVTNHNPLCAKVQICTRAATL